jgi:solute carrier family 50 protein (sugar transporter)
LLKNQPKVWVPNSIGLCLGCYFFVKFRQYAPSKAPTLPGSIRQHVNAIRSVILSVFLLIYISPFKDPAAIIGQAAVVFCIAMFGSPLAALKTVLETKSAKSIPLPFTLATIANCFLWSITGLFEMHDKNIYFRKCCRE